MNPREHEIESYDYISSLGLIRLHAVEQTTEAQSARRDWAYYIESLQSCLYSESPKKRTRMGLLSPPSRKCRAFATLDQVSALGRLAKAHEIRSRRFVGTHWVPQAQGERALRLDVALPLCESDKENFGILFPNSASRQMQLMVCLRSIETGTVEYRQNLYCELPNHRCVIFVPIHVELPCQVELVTELGKWSVIPLCRSLPTVRG